jgi:hypothetical protein
VLESASDPLRDPQALDSLSAALDDDAAIAAFRLLDQEEVVAMAAREPSDSTFNINDPDFSVLHNAKAGISIQTLINYFSEGLAENVLPGSTRSYVAVPLNSLMNASISVLRSLDQSFGTHSLAPPRRT